MTDEQQPMPDPVTHLRSSMEMLRQVEAEFAQASAAHQAALDSAESVRLEAERKAAELTREAEEISSVARAEANRRAEETVAAARAEADLLRRSAEADAERIRAAAHAEIAEARAANEAQQAGLIASRASLLERVEAITHELDAQVNDIGSRLVGVMADIATLRDEAALAPTPVAAPPEPTVAAASDLQPEPEPEPEPEPVLDRSAAPAPTSEATPEQAPAPEQTAGLSDDLAAEFPEVPAKPLYRKR